MALALVLKKDDHTPQDLRLLARAPYFDADLIRQKPNGEDEQRKRRRRRTPKLDSLKDEELLPAGTLIHSHGIAPSTREAIEKVLQQKLPTVDSDDPGTLMDAEELSELLARHAELRRDRSLKHLYQLLRTAAELGFQVAWYEELEEAQPRGWR